jgi:hypothetical protein
MCWHVWNGTTGRGLYGFIPVTTGLSRWSINWQSQQQRVASTGKLTRVYMYTVPATSGRGGKPNCLAYRQTRQTAFGADRRRPESLSRRHKIERYTVLHAPTIWYTTYHTCLCVARQTLRIQRLGYAACASAVDITCNRNAASRLTA